MDAKEVGVIHRYVHAKVEGKFAILEGQRLSGVRDRIVDDNVWRSDPQSERKKNTDDQEYGDHYRATEKSSAGSGTTSSGPQILLTIDSPTPETLL